MTLNITDEERIIRKNRQTLESIRRHPERIAAYRETHREQINAAQRRYTVSHPNRFKIYRKGKSTPTWGNGGVQEDGWFGKIRTTTEIKSDETPGSNQLIATPAALPQHDTNEIISNAVQLLQSMATPMCAY